MKPNNDVHCVVFLTGQRLSPSRISLPGGITAAWCRSLSDLEERIKQLRARTVVLDTTVTPEPAAVARARSAAGPDALLVVVGNRTRAIGEADVILDESAHELTRLLRFVSGQSVRTSLRTRCKGSAIIEGLATEPLPSEIVDVSEDGVLLAVPPARTADESPATLRISLPGGQALRMEAQPVRRIRGNDKAPETVAYRFTEIDMATRSVLRSFILRHASSDSRSTEEIPGLPVKRSGNQMIGESRAMRALTQTIERIAPSDVSVLLLGETGTGKELAARSLHEQSLRASKPFIAVNCAALPENLVESELFGHEQGAFTSAIKRKIGRIEQASGGTLFLDEIGDLPMPAQAKLLRALQERVIERVGGTEPIPVNIRLVAATNQDLEAGIASQKFRRDLLFRLNVVTIKLPPLRDRPEDVQPLAEHFLERMRQRFRKPRLQLSDAAVGVMSRYPWPGNVRELENVCIRIAAMLPDGTTITPVHLDLMPNEEPLGSPLPSTDLRTIIAFCEREIIRRVLRQSGGNRAETARVLGISRQTLYEKMGENARDEPRMARKR